MPFALTFVLCVQGDFLTPEHRKTISESTIVFVNNYAFGPEVDHMLKERLINLSTFNRINVHISRKTGKEKNLYNNFFHLRGGID